MFNNNEKLVAAIMANKTAWSALLGALIAQGTVSSTGATAFENLSAGIPPTGFDRDCGGA
ncbi:MULTISPECIES: hypothetical protein [Serratia]|uniref:hypothetical protein n=1 Tax=Serratia TaxID=613 RepID=UPI0013DBAF9E|nr:MULTISPECIES: hypothetical protein [Serratia]MBH2656233.1 hypothetical protein [Serratia ureilytica]MBJ2092165.1 hypothetical protein [Serratia ureilytica]